MGIFNEINIVAHFLIFFIPGFVSLKMYDLLIPNVPRDFTKSLAEIVTYSALNFAAFLLLVIPLLLFG